MRGPVITGSAVLTDGRLRYFGLPHSIDGVNGRVEFDAAGLRIETLAGRMGGGEVRFGGRIGIREGTPESYNLTAVGHDMRVRYPEGFRSQVDTDLALRGPVGAPVLTGTVLRQGRALHQVGRHGRHRAVRPRRLGRLGRGHADDGAVRLPAPLRPEDRRAVGAAHRQPVGAPGLERRPDAARHLQSAVAHRPRRHRPRRAAARRQPLPGHPRRHRVHQPDPHRPVLRRRGGDAGARPAARPTG